MIKSELVQRISAQNPHLYQRDVENIVNAILGEIVAAMARGDRVELRGFGAFSVKHRPARTGRNPRTGAHVSVGKKSVSFYPFDRVEPAISLSVPLYVLIMALVITGVIVGGLAAWLRQGKWRWRA